jgi:hypothetical protein
METDSTKVEYDPLGVTCEGFPTTEELEEKARALREQNPLWVWGDVYYENELFMREIIEQAKEEMFFAWGL